MTSGIYTFQSLADYKVGKPAKDVGEQWANAAAGASPLGIIVANQQLHEQGYLQLFNGLLRYESTVTNQEIENATVLLNQSRRFAQKSLSVAELARHNREVSISHVSHPSHIGESRELADKSQRFFNYANDMYRAAGESFTNVDGRVWPERLKELAYDVSLLIIESEQAYTKLLD